MHHFPADILTQSLAATPREGGTTMVQMLAALGVLLLCLSMLTLLRRRIRRTAAERGQSVQERIRSVREQAIQRSGQSAPTAKANSAARASVDSVMADAEELTRRLAAVLDNKAMAIEVLIEQANEAAARLERATAGQHGNSQNPTHRVSPQQPADPLAEEVYALTDRGMTSLEIASELDEPTGKVELILALRQPANPRTESSLTPPN